MVPTCVVIGAGILGASVAAELAMAGARVTVVDAGRPGATSATFGWVGASHPGLHISDAYLELNMRGVAAHRRWSDLCGDPSWFHRTGCLTWHTAPEAQARLVEHVTGLQARGYGAEILRPEQARDRIEPALRLHDEVTAVAWYPDEGYALARPMVGGLLATAQSLGATVRTGTAVSGFVHAGARVIGVELADGTRLEADTVIVAGGTATPELMELAGAKPVSLVPAVGERSLAVGLLVTSTPLLHPLTRMLVADELMMRPDGSGRVMLHRDAEDRLVENTTPTSPFPAAAQALVASAAAYIRADDAAVDIARIGVRPLTTDYLPAIGPSDGADGLYTVLTHSGVTLAPALGRIVADEILRGREEPLLKDLRPGRFH